MHPVERYALALGAKIDKPSVLDHFWPLPEDRYVCIYTSKKDSFKDYDFWGIVFEICFPIFKKFGLKTVQIGEQADPAIGAEIDLRGKTNLLQSNNIIKHCRYFVGVDSYFAHLAGFYDKPMTAIHGSSFLNCTKPFWGKKDEHFLIEPHREEKHNPSFILNENPKSVNKIKPEDIAAKIFKMIGCEDVISFKTLYVGDKCLNQIVDVIPDQDTDISAPKINLRLDLYFKEDNQARKILAKRKCEVTTCESFNLAFPEVRNIEAINYITESFNEDFVKQAKKLGIPLNLLCTSLDKLSSERKKLFDFQISLYEPEKIIVKNKEKFGEFKEGLKIKTMRPTVSGKNVYPSKYLWSKDIDDFFLDLEWVFVYQDS